jgi:hypothetical protein
LQIFELHQKGKHNKLRPQWGYSSRQATLEYIQESKSLISKNGNAKKEKEVETNMPTNKQLNKQFNCNC